MYVVERNLDFQGSCESLIFLTLTINGTGLVNSQSTAYGRVFAILPSEDHHLPLKETNTPRAPPDGDALALLKNIKKRENGAAETQCGAESIVSN